MNTEKWGEPSWAGPATHTASCQLHTPHPARAFCSLPCNEGLHNAPRKPPRIRGQAQQQPPQGEVGWWGPRPAGHLSKLCACVCCTHLCLGWEKKRKRGRKQNEPKVVCLFVFLKRALKNGILKRNATAYYLGKKSKQTAWWGVEKMLPAI